MTRIVYRDVYLSPITGIDIMDPISLEVRPMENHPELSFPFTAQEIQWLNVDSLGELYILTRNQDVYRFDKEGLHHLFRRAEGMTPELGIGGGLITSKRIKDHMFEIRDRNGKLLKQVIPQLPDRYQKMNGNWRPVGEIGYNRQMFFYIESETFVHFLAIISSEGVFNIQPHYLHATE